VFIYTASVVVAHSGMKWWATPPAGRLYTFWVLININEITAVLAEVFRNKYMISD